MRTPLISPFARIFLKEVIKNSRAGKDIDTAIRRGAGKIVDKFINLGEDPILETFQSSLGWFQLNKALQDRAEAFEEGWNNRVKYWRRKVKDKLGEGYSWKLFLENNRLITAANYRGDE